MKITIYELLGLVKDGKAPKKIKEGNTIYWLNNSGWYETLGTTTTMSIWYKERLDSTVEIIEEEKEIEHYDLVDNYEVMNDKIIANNFEHINEELEWLVREIKKLKEQKNNGYNT